MHGCRSLELDTGGVGQKPPCRRYETSVPVFRTSIVSLRSSIEIKNEWGSEEGASGVSTISGVAKGIPDHPRNPP